MKKKGFTLVELMLIIVIIGVVATIATASYLGIQRRSIQRLYESKISLIETKSENWANEVQLKNQIVITVNRLVIEGFFDADDVNGNVDNPLYPSDSKDKYLNCYLVFIDFENGKPKAKYENKQDCNLKQDYLNDENIKITARTESDKALKIENDIIEWTRENVILSVTHNYGDVFYSWYKNGARIENADTAEYLVTTSYLLDETHTIVLSTDLGKKQSSIKVRIDKEKPEKTKIKVSSNSKWNDGKIKLTVTSTDLGSGIQHYEYCTNDCGLEKNWIIYDNSSGNKYETVLDENEVYLSIRAVDNVGNKGDYPDPVLLFVDRDAPVIAVENPNHDKWVDYDYSVKLTATDEGKNVSGINRYEYSYDGVNWTEYEYSALYEFVTPKFNFEGNRLVYFRAFDLAGNESNIVSTRIKIDKTPPTIPTTGSISASGITDVGGSTDVGSGVKEYQYMIIKQGKNETRIAPTNTDSRWGYTTTFTVGTGECDTRYHGYAIAIDNFGHRSAVYYIGAYGTKDCCTPKTDNSVCAESERDVVYTCEGKTWKCTRKVTGYRGNWTMYNYSGGGSGGSTIGVYSCNAGNQINMGGDYLGNGYSSNYGVISGDKYTLYNYSAGHIIGIHYAICTIHTTYYSYTWIRQ